MEDRVDLAKLYQFSVLKMIVVDLVLFVLLLVPDRAGFLVRGAEVRSFRGVGADCT
jgi:hypothetical protein